MNDPGQPSSWLVPPTPSVSWGVQIPDQTRPWQAIEDQHRQVTNGGESPAQRWGPQFGCPRHRTIPATKWLSPVLNQILTPTQLSQNLTHPQPSQRASANHTTLLAGNPQPQPNLAQANPAAERRFPQQRRQESGGGGVQNPIIQDLDRWSQLGNPQHQGKVPLHPQVLEFLHKLDSLPVRDLELQVGTWRESLALLDDRVWELLGAASRPGATPWSGPAYDRAANEMEQSRFLLVKAQEILSRKYVEANQIVQAQAQANAQTAAQRTSAPVEPARRGKPLQVQAPGMPSWQSQPRSSSIPQLSPQVSSPSVSSTLLRHVTPPQPEVKQQSQQATFSQNVQRNTAIPRDRPAFVHLIGLWFIRTGGNPGTIPWVGDKPIDLHQLYIEVETLGGVEKLQGTGRWRLVAAKMGYVTREQSDHQVAQTAKVLADTYVAFLVPFDSFCMDRQRAVGNGIQNNRPSQTELTRQVGVGANQMISPGLRQGWAGIMPDDGGAMALLVPNLQRVLAFLLQVTLKDWLPELSPQTKLLRAAQMDLPAMQREGWPADRIQVVQRFREVLIRFRDAVIRQQQLHQQRLSQQGMQQENVQAQAQVAQVQEDAHHQQSHVNDHRSSSGGGSLPTNMQAPNLHNMGALKMPFAPEAIERARAIVTGMSREIEQTRQYNRREVPEVQRVQMNQTVVASHPFAVEFERIASLHYMLFNDQQQTRALMEQATLLREQHRILQGGQQRYIMTPEEVRAVETSLQTAVHQLKTTYKRKLEQHQEQMASLRAAEVGDPAMGQQLPNAPAEDVSTMFRGIEQNRQLFPSLAANPVSPTPSGNHIQRGSQKVPRRQEAARQVEVPPPPASLPLGGSEAEKPVVRATKRRLEKEHQENAEEPGAALKRGKIIHRDYANTALNNADSHLHKKYAADGTTQDIGTGDPARNSQLIAETKPGQISCEEIFQRLVKHGCVDLSSHMDPGQYSSGLIIGGAFGDIWKGKLLDGTEVAIKVWRFSSLLHNGRKFVKRAMREIYYWSKAKHKYVQELMGVIMFQGRLGMVSRWMDHGNLREYICKNPSVDRYVLCTQVAAGIAYLHGQAMVHGDLKGINILISCDGVAKLSDFDHSIMLGCSLVFSDTSKLGGGTTRWMAPELILEDDCSRSTYTDIYSLGMTMLEIITGAPPYYPHFQEDVQVIRAIMKKNLPARPTDHLGGNLRGNRMWELLLSCWNYEPLARPKATEVVESLRNIMTLPASSAV